MNRFFITRTIQVFDGKAFKERRKAEGITLKKIADLAGISVPFLSDIEHGHRQPSEAVARKIVQVFEELEGGHDAMQGH